MHFQTAVVAFAFLASSTSAGGDGAYPEPVAGWWVKPMPDFFGARDAGTRETLPSAVGALREVRTTDGGDYFDGGSVGQLILAVGSAVQFALPKHALMYICDAPIVRVETLATGFRMVGISEGTTKCGWWFNPGPSPDRLLEITVVGSSDGAAELADAGA